MSKIIISTVCFLVVLPIINLNAVDAQKSKDGVIKPVFSIDEVGGFFRREDLSGMEKIIQNWQKGPSYLKLSLLETLTDHLKTLEKCSTRNYIWEEGTHDLNRKNGRAAWAIEKLLEIKLDKITPDSTWEENQKIYNECANIVKAYRAGIMSAASEVKNIKTKEELTKSYKDKIKPGISTKHEESFNSMSSLLSEWFPIGRKLSDLEEIVGTPGTNRPKENCIDYDFQNGVDGVLYRFTVEDGIITSVLILGID
jgi:hypothetical protein